MNDRRQELNSNINLVKLTRTVFVLLFFSQISQLLDITHILGITIGESSNKTLKKSLFHIFGNCPWTTGMEATSTNVDRSIFHN